MEEMLFLNFDPNLNRTTVSDLQLCQTWEVACSGEFVLPLESCSQLEEVQQNSNLELSNIEKNKTNAAYCSEKKTNHNRVSINPKKCNKPKMKRLSQETEPGPDCGCPIRCFKKIGNKTIYKIFKDFWSLADYNSQNAYLFGLIDIIKVKRRYTKNEKSRRNFTVMYHVKDKGRNVPVCKKAFLSIHGLHRSRGRVNNLANKMKEGESVPSPDKRGRHNNRPNAYSVESIEHVRRHLLLCPKIDRNRRNSSKVSKQMMFSTKRCYALYVNEYCKKNELIPVSLDKFRRVFAKEGYKNLCKWVQK